MHFHDDSGNRKIPPDIRGRGERSRDARGKRWAATGIPRAEEANFYSEVVKASRAFGWKVVHRGGVVVHSRMVASMPWETLSTILGSAPRLARLASPTRTDYTTFSVKHEAPSARLSRNISASSRQLHRENFTREKYIEMEVKEDG